MRSGLKRLAAGLLAATSLAGFTAPSLAYAPAEVPALTPTSLQVTTPIPARVLSLYNNAAHMCGPITGGAANPVIEQRIQDFNRVINQSQTGRDLMRAASTYDAQPAWMCFKDMGSLHAAYYIGRGVFTVGMSKTNSEIVADAAHELRHLFQEKAGLYNIEPQSNDDRIHLEYASEADAEATAALMMWELKVAGHPGPWDMHNNPNHYGPRSICYAHISTAFKNAVEAGRSSVEATSDAFRTWYRDEDLLSTYRSNALELAKQHAAQASSCHAPQPDNSRRGYQIPSDYIVERINAVVGQLPSYNVNYLQQSGGLRAILQAP